MYPDSNSKSARLFARACDVMPGGNSRLAVYQSPYPIFIASGAGCRVRDADGVERVDFINNQSALVHGHCFAPVVAAAEVQIRLGASFSGPTEAELELGEHLQRRVPGFERVRFTNSGSEAVMFAVKAARAFTGRFKIAKCEGAYHGSYDFVETSRGSTPANWGDPSAPARVPYTKGTPPAVADHTLVIPYNDVPTGLRLLEAEGEALAAIIVEPVANRPGMIPASPAFLKALREFATRNGSVLIFDEIISFRLGVGGAQADYGIHPDITTVGKVIGGGFPVGALGGRGEIMAVFDQRAGSPAVPHTGTFNANPVSMRAGRAALEALDAAAIARINAHGDQLRAAMATTFAEEGIEGQVTGKGSLFRVHFRSGPLHDYRSAYPSPDESKAISRLHRALLNRNVIVSANCSGNISTVITDAEIDAYLSAFRASLRDVFASAA